MEEARLQEKAGPWNREQFVYLKGRDAGCGGNLCSQAVETEWGLLGWLPGVHAGCLSWEAWERGYVLSPRERADLGHILRPGMWEFLCVPQVKTQLGIGLALLSRGLAGSHTPAGSAEPE